MTYNGTFRHDLTLEEFEAELRSFLVPEENKTSSWKERLFGRVTNEIEKEFLYVLPPSYCPLSCLLMRHPLIFKIAAR